MSRALRAQRRDVIAAKHLFCDGQFEWPALPHFTTNQAPMIELQEIANSSNLAAAGYSEADRVFAVRFKNGKVYHHMGVEPETAAAFNAAESKGAFYAREIRGKHQGELVVEGEAV